MLASKLRGIAIIAGLLALALGVVALMPGRLVMYRGFKLFADGAHDFSTVSAGGLLGALHGGAALMLAFGLWRKPDVGRAWSIILILPLLALITRGIDAVIWNGYALWPTLAGRIYDGLELALLAIAIVVLPLALYLARRTNEAPRARVV